MRIVYYVIQIKNRIPFIIFHILQNIDAIRNMNLMYEVHGARARTRIDTLSLLAYILTRPMDH